LRSAAQSLLGRAKQLGDCTLAEASDERQEAKQLGDCTLAEASDERQEAKN
jgi:hypothetical protein